MANTIHQDVVSLRRSGVRNRGGNSSLQILRKASSKGKSPVSNPRSAPRGLTAVPVSTASLPPGLGPSMGAASSGRGLSKLRKNAKVHISSSAGPSPYPAYGGTTVWNASPIWNPAAVSDLVASPRRGRRGRKR